jgi:hypothetical protein
MTLQGSKVTAQIGIHRAALQAQAGVGLAFTMTAEISGARKKLSPAQERLMEAGTLRSQSMPAFTPVI